MSIRAQAWVGVLAGADYGEIYIQESITTVISFEDSQVVEVAHGKDHGMGLRYLIKENGRLRTLHGSTSSWDPDRARLLSQKLLPQKIRTDNPVVPGTLSRARNSVSRSPLEVPLEEKIGILKKADAAVRKRFPFIRQVSATYGEGFKRFIILNSAGDFREEERISVIFSVQATAEKDGRLQTGGEVAGAAKGFELFSEKDPVELALTAAQRAITKLDCPPAKPGEMPVVISSRAGGTIIHEAVGHSLEADHIQEGVSPVYQGKLGKTVAPEFLTIIDDPTIPSLRGSFWFDDEGMEAKASVLVENGILKDYLYDRVTAYVDSRDSNCHGRRESYHHRPIPRMSNLYIAPGKDDPEAILRELDRGLFVTRLGGGEVNTTTGEFMFEVDEGFWVEGGKIRHPVRDANLLGVGPEVLASIDRLGRDLNWAIGTCGKGGQGVPVTDGIPTLRIPKLLIGGRD